MISNNWLARLERVHETRGRVRWRYRCRPEASYAAEDITLAASRLPGVVKARSNATACSLIVEFVVHQTNVDALEAGLLALDAPLPLRSGKKNATRASDTGGVITRLFALLVTQGLPQTLKTPVTLAAAAPLLAHALADLRESGLTSHVLEALAVSISVARKDYLAANTTSFMLALGEHLEESIARRSEELLKHLAHPVSDEVWVEHDGKEILTPIAEVQVGDTVVAATGIVIPIDGTVLGGEATVNEASMTGESTPVVKIRGDAVLSGTPIEEGRIRIYAEHVGGMTAVARIADYVEQSLTAKSEAQLHASRLADRLVPAVLGLAGAAFVLTQDWVRVASVLQAD
jgi:cation transport ATPase